MSSKSTISTNRLSRLQQTVSNRLTGLTIVAEGTHLRHNLSAIIRTAESFGVSKVHLISSERQKTSGAAKGGERWVDLSVHKNTKQCFDLLKKDGFTILVADLQDDSFTPETAPIDGPLAIVMGTELVGVSQEAKELADGTIMIPMYGLTQSLNVSVASACVLQRISTRMREAGVGAMSDTEQQQLLTRWLDRESTERVQRQNRRQLGNVSPQQKQQ